METASEEPLWIAEGDAAALLTIADAIDVLANAHRLYAEGAASNMVKAHTQSGPSNLHAVGAIIAGAGVAGTKTWIHTPGGAQPLLLLFSSDDGRVQAVVEAFALGQRRTSATSALATRELARPESSSMALVGTGKQAPAQVEAVAAVRPLTEIAIYGRDAERRADCAARIRERVEAEVREEPSLPAALAGADIVTLVTRAAEPFVEAEMIAPGTHVNGVGAILPDRRELTVEAVAGMDRVFADSRVQAEGASGELREAVAMGAVEWDRVRELGELIADPNLGRTDAGQRTFFKAMGVGIADVALGAEVLRRARAEGLGAPLPQIQAAHH